MKLLAFAASNSKKSINKRLVTYAASLLEGADVEVLDLNDYEMPLFSVDKEEELGHPALAKAFLAKIAASDALIISFAEHNGSYSVAYKNLFAGDVKATLSIPSFFDNFDLEQNTLKNEDLKQKLIQAVACLKEPTAG